jgi:hypothetical protein
MKVTGSNPVWASSGFLARRTEPRIAAGFLRG